MSVLPGNEINARLAGCRMNEKFKSAEARIGTFV